MQNVNKIIDMMRNGLPVSKICHSEKISLKELYDFVRVTQEKGNGFYPKASVNGEIVFVKERPNDDDPVIVKVKNGEFVFAASSDIHAGSAYDNMKRVEQFCNYFYSQGINNHVNLGDNIDGFPKSFAHLKRTENSIESQIDKVILNFPYVSGINIVVPGDHDDKYKCKDGYSISKALKLNRKDIKVFSSGFGILNINGVEFALCHRLDSPFVKERAFDNRIVLYAHSHLSSNIICVPSLTLPRCGIPSLSDLPVVNHRAPGFKIFQLHFDGSVLVEIIESLYVCFDDQIYLANKETYQFTENIAAQPVRTKGKGGKIC